MKPTTQGVFDKRGATFGNLVFRKPPHSDSQAGYLSPSLQRIQGHRFLARPAPDPTRSLAVSIKHFSSRLSHELYPHTLCSLTLQQGEGQQQRFAFPKVALSDSQAGYLSPSPEESLGTDSRLGPHLIPRARAYQALLVAPQPRALPPTTSAAIRYSRAGAARHHRRISFPDAASSWSI